MKYITHVDSPAGELLLASDGERLTGLWLAGQKHYAAGLNAHAEEKVLPVFEQTKAWLDAYFAGGDPDPSAIPVLLFGSGYRCKIWQLLCEIPYGKVTTYGQLAQRYRERFGAKTSPRAVGGAVGRNPISILIPCHRVIGSGGFLTGYAGGLEAKCLLLKLEQEGSVAK